MPMTHICLKTYVRAENSTQQFSLPKQQHNSSMATAAAATTATPEQQPSLIFSVLYYKCVRHRKVHASKGVSKLDGRLTMDWASGRIILTSDESIVVYSGQLPRPVREQWNNDDNKAMESLTLGAQYQVEIIAKVVENNSTANPKNSGKPPKAMMRTMGGCQRRPLVPATSNHANRIPTARRPPPQPKRTGRLSPNAATAAVSSPSSPPLSSKDDATPTTTTTKTKTIPIRPKRALVASSRAPTLPPMHRRPPPQPTTHHPPTRTSQCRRTAPVFPKLPPPKPIVASPPPLPTPVITSSKPRAPNNNNNNKNAAAADATTSATPNKSSCLPHLPLPHSIRMALRPHQIQGVDFLHRALQAGGAILADEMGLGKTLMTIAIACIWHRQQRDKHFLVVCPSSLVGNWAHEFDKWLGPTQQPKRVVIRQGGATAQAAIRAYCQAIQQNSTQHRHNRPGQVLIVSYDLFRRHAAEFPTGGRVGLLVVDEGHRLKNTAGSQTLTALTGLAVDARLCITATPLQNNLCEFYALVDFCRPNVLGSLAEFRQNFERPIRAAATVTCSPAQVRLGRQQAQALEHVCSSFLIRRRQADVKIALPPRSERLLFCRLANGQRAPYARICDDYTSQHKCSGGGATADALQALTTLRKICTHPALAEEEDDDDDPSMAGNIANSSAVQASGKLIVLEALLKAIRSKAPDDKVVLVSNFTSALSTVEQLVLEPNEYAFARLDGSTELSQRQVIVDSFNKPSSGTFCLLLSSKAGGCGLNLVGSNRLILLDPDWNPATDIQAMGRIYRQGQTKPCTIYRFLTMGTVEEVIYQRQCLKTNLATWTVDQRSKASSSSSRLSPDELNQALTLSDTCTTPAKLGWNMNSAAKASLDPDNVDLPLAQVQDAVPETLVYAHRVLEPKECTDEHDAISLNNTCSDTEDYDDDSENEFDMPVRVEKSVPTASTYVDTDSDSECEF